MGTIKKPWMWFFLLLLLLAPFSEGCDCDDPGAISKAKSLRARPSSVTFGALPIGQTDKKTLVIENNGEGDVTISSITLKNTIGGNAFSVIKTPELPKTLKATETLELEIQYQPVQAGTNQGKLLVDSNDLKDPLEVPVQATEIASKLNVVPNPVDFGAVPPAQPKTETVQISNSGTSALQIKSLTFESNKDNEFVVKNPPTLPLVIEPGKTSTLDIEYTPKKAVANETLIIENTSPQNGGKFYLKLIGQMAAPDIEVTPSSLTYSDVRVGGSGKKTFTIANKGMVDLEVSVITLDPQGSSDFKLLNLPNLPLVIAPNKSVDLEVEYTSSDQIDDKGRVIIESNDPDTAKTYVLLSSNADGCNLQSLPPKVTFIRQGKVTVTLTNKGTVFCDYKTASLSPTTSKEFTLTTPLPSSQKIQPGQSIQVEVVFLPTDSNEDQGELWVEFQDPKDPPMKIVVESKKGSTYQCDIIATPSSINYGFVGLGKAVIKKIEVTNNGYGDCVLTNAQIAQTYQVFSVQTTVPAGGITVTSGSSATFDVAYTPPSKTGSPHSGTFSIQTTDTRTPEIKVSLLGSTGELCLEAFPEPMDFGSVKTRCSTPKTSIEIFHVCKAQGSVTITGIKFGAQTNRPVSEFFLKSSPKTSFDLSYGQSFKLEMTYVPVDLGQDNGTLEVANSVVGQSPVVINLLGKGVSTSDQTDHFTQTLKPELDLLFVIDNSCSMQSSQTSLSTNMNTFLNWTKTLQVDYHIGVTTTDVDTSSGAKGCLVGSTKIVTPNTPSGVSILQTTVKVGTSGSSNEKPLQASELALSGNALTGCNKGFYRTDASLSVIYITDEPDYSPNTVSYYINFLKNIKGIRNPDKIRVSAIADRAASSCTTGNCRLYEVVNSLRGIYDAITTNNWGQTLTQLGSITFGYQSQFYLSRPADPNSIVVKVNGSVVTQSSSNGWSYNTSNNSVTFSTSSVPSAGANIEISYQSLCLPP